MEPVAGSQALAGTSQPRSPQILGLSPAQRRGVHYSSWWAKGLRPRAGPLGLQPLPLLLFLLYPIPLMQEEYQEYEPEAWEPRTAPTSSTIPSAPAL